MSSTLRDLALRYGIRLDVDIPDPEQKPTDPALLLEEAEREYEILSEEAEHDQG